MSGIFPEKNGFPTEEPLVNLTLSQILQLAIQHFNQGKLHQAEGLCRQILQVVPNQPDALHLLGVIAYQTQHHESAIQLIQRAIIHHPDLLEAYYHLAIIFKELGKHQESISCYEKGLAKEFNLGDSFSLEKWIIFLCQSSPSIWQERRESILGYCRKLLK